jgi:lipid-A-disaccharide synthase
MKKQLSFMIVAGEPSGDSHSAKLVRAIRETAPEFDVSFFGATGARMREAGVETIVNADHLSIIGLPEIARALPTFWAAFKQLKRAAKERRPDAVLLTDFPDFNLKLARSLKKLGITVINYKSPQIWAWRKYRIRTIKKYVDLVIAILPFEKEWYEKQGVEHVVYVGSPLAREIRSDTPKAEFCRKHGVDPHRPIVSLLPGSRHKEIDNILPTLLETAARMTAADDRIQFLVALASPRSVPDAENAIRNLRGSDERPDLRVIAGETLDALNASDAAAVTSGTATLETAIIGTPMAVVYKTSALNYALLRPLISVEHFGLVNLITGERVAKELIQDDLSAKSLADELFRLLEPKTNAEMRAVLRATSDKLGHGGASRRAAEAILDVILGDDRTTPVS